MKEEKFTKILGEIDEKYVAEVFEETKAKRILPFKKIVAIAACICLLIAGTTVAIGGMNKVNYSTSYEFDFQADFFSYDVFGEGMDDFKGKFFARPYYQRSYENSTEAMKVLGYDGIIIPDLGIEEKYSKIAVLMSDNEDSPGYGDKEIGLMEFAVGYDVGDDILNYTADMFFAPFYRYDGKSFHIGPYSSYGVLYSEPEYYTNRNGIEVMIMEKKIVDENNVHYGKIGVNAFVVKDDIFYELNAVYDKEDSRQFKKYIREWSESF
ncbi:MAG: hypothetical protein IKJ82_06880 [Oscillospiraceae bacterium]|nr:hypothetical protein [Oscillospiraceae bacterium]